MGVPAVESATCRVNGHDLHYLVAGSGPPIVFLHGLLGSNQLWAALAQNLAGDHVVVAPDLFGHGASDKTVEDYSLSAHAATVRDLMDHLGLDKVMLVGHSLGGGVALQFSYLFPDRTDRLVLVAAGGLGREVNLLLRAPSLLGAEVVLPVLASGWVRRRGVAVGKVFSKVGLRGSRDLEEAWRGFESLSDAESRRAFLATVRSVVGLEGQRMSASEHLPRLAGRPTLIVWGDRDSMIPVAHARAAAERIPDAQLVVFEGAGHFPHLDQPERFAETIRAFCGGTGRARATG